MIKRIDFTNINPANVIDLDAGQAYDPRKYCVDKGVMMDQSGVRIKDAININPVDPNNSNWLFAPRGVGVLSDGSVIFVDNDQSGLVAIQKPDGTWLYANSTLDSINWGHACVREVGGKVFITLAKYLPYDDCALIVIDPNTGDILHERSTYPEVSAYVSQIASAESIVVNSRLFVTYYSQLFEIDTQTYALTHRKSIYIYTLMKSYNGDIFAHSPYYPGHTPLLIDIITFNTTPWSEARYGWHLREMVNGKEVHYEALRPGVGVITGYMTASFLDAQGAWVDNFGIPIERSEGDEYLIVGTTSNLSRSLFRFDVRGGKRVILPAFSAQDAVPVHISLKGSLTSQVKVFWRKGSYAYQDPDTGWSAVDTEDPQSSIVPDTQGWQLALYFANVPWLKGPDGQYLPYYTNSLQSPTVERMDMVLESRSATWRSVEVKRTKEIIIRRS